MVVEQRIQIAEYWEFQVCQQVFRGEPNPIGEPKRSLRPEGFIEEGRYDLDPKKTYAVKRRKVTLDDEGYPTYSNWEWVTEWKRPNVRKLGVPISRRTPPRASTLRRSRPGHRCAPQERERPASFASD